MTTKTDHNRPKTTTNSTRRRWQQKQTATDNSSNAITAQIDTVCLPPTQTGKMPSSPLHQLRSRRVCDCEEYRPPLPAHSHLTHAACALSCEQHAILGASGSWQTGRDDTCLLQLPIHSCYHLSWCGTSLYLDPTKNIILLSTSDGGRYALGSRWYSLIVEMTSNGFPFGRRGRHAPCRYRTPTTPSLQEQDLQTPTARGHSRHKTYTREAGMQNKLV